MVEQSEANSNFRHIPSLLQLLQPLDRLLVSAVTAIPEQPQASHPDDKVQQWLDRGADSGADSEIEFPSDAVSPDSPLAWLQQTFGLSNFDINVMAIALAPDLDRRYEHLFAYIQQDSRCRRPTVDLALNLLCPSGTDKLMRQIHFAANAPLLRHNLLHLFPEPHGIHPTLLSHSLKLDAQIVRFLLGQPGLDERLAPWCDLLWCQVDLEQIPLELDTAKALVSLVTQDWQSGYPLGLYFQGTDSWSKRRTAEALARAVKAPLLVADLSRISLEKTELESMLKLLFREAWFQGSLLYLHGLDVFADELLTCLVNHPGITILSGEQPWVATTAVEPTAVTTVLFPIPDTDRRLIYWQQHLQATGIDLDGLDLETVSDRFRLTPNQIANAVATVHNQIRWQTALKQTSPDATTKVSTSTVDLFAAARAQSSHSLGTLARQIKPKHNWDDIILPPNQISQLREICSHVKYDHLVWKKWGFEQKLSLGQGLNVLFSGLPGTGKTMAAEVIAAELQLDLYKIDLSQIVSKYIGETEKNLNRIFTAATNANAILLFDEADSLFGKRSEVQDAHDRYANIEIGYLLQKMEEYEGVAILTTNLRNNIDDAFSRRLRFIVDFPFPNEDERCQIWQQIWPDTLPRSSDINLDLIARHCEIAGGNIRNIALAAAFLAAEDGGVVTMSHLTRAIRREYQKMGKVLMQQELEVSLSC